jgi:hypothetical protein
METLLPAAVEAGEDIEAVKKRAKLQQDADGDAAMKD